jgi:hypothetical protein
MSELVCGVCYSCQVCVECEAFKPRAGTPQPFCPTPPPQQVRGEELERIVREIVLQVLIELGLVKGREEGRTVA